jgi:hypothetical protein
MAGFDGGHEHGGAMLVDVQAQPPGADAGGVAAVGFLADRQQRQQHHVAELRGGRRDRYAAELTSRIAERASTVDGSPAIGLRPSTIATQPAAKVQQLKCCQSKPPSGSASR